MKFCAIHEHWFNTTCFLCRAGFEPQRRCKLDGTYPASCAVCPRCVLRAMGARVRVAGRTGA